MKLLPIVWAREVCSHNKKGLKCSELEKEKIFFYFELMVIS